MGCEKGRLSCPGYAEIERVEYVPLDDGLSGRVRGWDLYIPLKAASSASSSICENPFFGGKDRPPEDARRNAWSGGRVLTSGLRFRNTASETAAACF